MSALRLGLRALIAEKASTIGHGYAGCWNLNYSIVALEGQGAARCPTGKRGFRNRRLYNMTVLCLLKRIDKNERRSRDPRH